MKFVITLRRPRSLPPDRGWSQCCDQCHAHGTRIVVMSKSIPSGEGFLGVLAFERKRKHAASQLTQQLPMQAPRRRTIKWVVRHLTTHLARRFARRGP